MKQKLPEFLFFLTLKKDHPKKILLNARNQLTITFSKTIAILLFFFFATFFSNLQAQITVAPTSFCQGIDPAPNVALSIRITTGLSPYTVRYRIGPATSPIITRTGYLSTSPIAVPLPNVTTPYTIVSITDRTGATVPITGSVTVTVIPRPNVPQITASGPTTLCQGESVVLTSSPGTTYRWTTPQGTILTTQSIIANLGGNYTVQVTNANGCLSVSSIAKTITIAPLSAPKIETTTPPNCLIATGSVTLSGLPTGTWTINPGAITGTGTTTTLSGLNIGDYQFTVTNQSGCVSLPSQTISMNMETAPTEVPVLNPEINGCKASFTQTWKAVPGATGYRLDVSTDPDFTSFLAGYQDKELSNITSETVTGITPGAVYYVRLKAINSCGASPYSNSIDVSPVTTTYENGVWSNGFPDSTKSIVFNSDFNINSNMNGCSCQVNAGANVTVQSAISLKLENALNVASTGSITFENSASLLQVNNVPNTGSINYKRTALQIRQADYVYWSTPVTPQKLIDVSPLTNSGTFYAHIGNGWVGQNRNNNMVVGKGYIIRGPENYSNTTKKDYTATFKGTPNNGDILGEELTAIGKFSLIGNPYPSALSADALLAANPFLEGTLYFWTHNTPVVLGGAYQYTQDDYNTYNLTGGVATSKSAPSDPNHSNDPANDRGNRPTGQIGAGQSFFIGINAIGKVSFNNTMRSGGTDNTQFYKQSNTARSAGIEKHRIWLNLTNKGGAFKQLLVGYIQGATNSFDSRYDGNSFNANKYIDFYSVVDDATLVIQGRALPFADTDVVPLGYKTTIAGEFTIEIDEVDGLFKNQAIYLEDKQTNTFVDLRCKNYTFNTLVGTFNDRFVIHYNNPDNRQFVLSPVASSHTLFDCSQTSYIQEWTPAPDAAGYKLDVATDSNFTSFLTGYEDKELGNVTSDTITGIVPGVTYYVRLRTFNGCGESLNSNVVTIDPISTTYENGTWSNGLPDGSKTAVFNSDYSIATDLNACSCKVNAGAVVTVESGITLKLENSLNVAETGTLIFENNASLVQINETPNTGKIVYKRTSSPMKIFDYNYWSSPVMGQKLNDLSPNTVSDKYFSFDNNKWINENGNNQMIAAKGYTIQAPKPARGSNGEFVSFPYSQPVQFIGVPNNGHQEFTTDGSGYLNLIGNPYPSAIDADLFLEANRDVLEGTIYLWTRSNSYLQNIFNPDDYAVYNALGGIAIANSNLDSGVSNSIKPTGKIAAGQSFFVESLASGTVSFNNTMRVSGQNTQFFKQAQDSTATAAEKHRFWLNLSNKLGVFKQILIGYTTDATNDYDHRFDSKTWDRNPYANFYSINSDANLSIQGRALPFDNTDVVALGYRATIGGTFSIAIDQVDGLFIAQDIYLEDKVRNEYHNLKQGPYTFSTFGGTFNNRFIVHYSIFSGSNPNLLGSNKILVSVGDNQIQVNSSKQKIQKVIVYDFNGRLIFEKNNINNNNFLTDKLFIKKQILIVKTTLENGNTDSYKVIF